MKPYYEEKGITIYHGDCREILPLAADSVLTDPPYGTQGLGGGYGRRQLHSIDGRNGRCIEGDENLEVVDETVPLLWRSLPDEAWCIAFCATRRMLETGGLFKSVGFEFYGEIIWDKCAPGLGYTIRYAHESALVFRKGEVEKAAEPIMSIQRESVDRIDTQGRHPHEKPVSVLKGMLLLSAGAVLDPFMGSGTTLRAAKDLGRRAIGIEIEEKYCEIAARRLSQSVLDFNDGTQEKHSNSILEESGQDQGLLDLDRRKAL